jgi:tagatose-6-phosphate ketose/aldose isomerase
MITEPDRYVHPTRPTLCISYGRSGNSPESVGSVHAANTVNKNLYHLFITCNKNGALAELAKTQKNTYALILPDETNDLGFAMTSSFTSMYLSTVLVFKLDSLDETKEDVEKLAKAVEYLIEHESAGLLDFVNNFKFERIIYLGSNLLKGIAQESALKVLELTAGNVATLFDTPTGFRHGPKSFINDKSLIVVYLSDDPLTRRYEVDLLKELGAQKKGYKVLVVHHEDANVPCDYKLNLNYDGLSMDYVALKAIVVAHLIGFYKSYTSGITTDNPCPTGEVNRVVTGVTIYPVKED